MLNKILHKIKENFKKISKYDQVLTALLLVATLLWYLMAVYVSSNSHMNVEWIHYTFWYIAGINIVSILDEDFKSEKIWKKLNVKLLIILITITTSISLFAMDTSSDESGSSFDTKTIIGVNALAIKEIRELKAEIQDLKSIIENQVDEESAN